MRAVICDLDGTLFDIRHRLHHVTMGGHDWDAFFAGILGDSICEPIAGTVEALRRAGNAIVLASGRPEKCRNDSEIMLSHYGVFYDALYMRPDYDFRPDHVVKAQILDGIIADGFEPWLVIDDRQSVVEMWRERGLTCLQCAPSDTEIPNDAVLTLMVGPSGAGKSTWLKDGGNMVKYGIAPTHIISSDVTRFELCGDFRDQSKNEQVFAAVHAIAKARIKNGLPTVIDATHIRRRDRVAAAMLAEGKCKVRYIVVDRPLDEKRKSGGWRNEVKKDGQEFDLIGRHDQTFRSQIKEILAGDNLPNVEVIDCRNIDKSRSMAA